MCGGGNDSGTVWALQRDKSRFVLQWHYLGAEPGGLLQSAVLCVGLICNYVQVFPVTVADAVTHVLSFPDVIRPGMRAGRHLQGPAT